MADEKSLLFSEVPVRKAVLTLAVPTVISQLITVVYNMADRLRSTVTLIFACSTTCLEDKLLRKIMLHPLKSRTAPSEPYLHPLLYSFYQNNGSCSQKAMPTTASFFSMPGMGEEIQPHPSRFLTNTSP